MRWTAFHRLASPPHFHGLAGRWLRLLHGAALLLAGSGIVWGLVFAPPDYQQGEVYRIIYLHVPAAWISLMLYTAMAVAGTVAVVWRLKLAEIAVISLAPVGASFTALALATGMLWGKPTWGAYWVWDARLTSELILLFLYLGVIALNQAMSDPRAGARAASLLAIIGWINVPIVHFSVEWWNSLHQTASIMKLGRPSLDAGMLWPLLLSALGLSCFAFACALQRMRGLNLLRNAQQRWVSELERATGRVAGLG